MCRSCVLLIALLLALPSSAWAQTYGPVELLNPNGLLAGHDTNPEVATDSSGTWVAVWQSTETMAGSLGPDGDILFARSTDFGVTWSYPAPLNSNAAIDSGYDGNVVLRTDGLGNWVATWESNDSLGGTIGTDFDVLFSRSTDGGRTWSAVAPLNTNAASDSGHDMGAVVVTDRAGQWLASWSTADSLGGTIGTDGDVLYARSSNGGATWSAPAPLNNDAAFDAGGDGNPDVVTDGDGHWLAVWVSAGPAGGINGTDYDLLVARSSDAGATWTNPAPLNTNAGSDTGWDYLARVATDGQGVWLATWSSSNQVSGSTFQDVDVYFARSVDDGTTWSTPVPLQSNAAIDRAYDYYSRPIADGAGDWVVAWETSFIAPLGFNDQDIAYVRSSDDGQTWTPFAPLNSDAVTDSTGEGQPDVATDANGNWMAVWGSTKSFPGSVYLDWNIYFARSTDNGATWTPIAPLNVNATGVPGPDVGASLATDAVAWGAVWSTKDTLAGQIGTDGDIAFSRSLNAGASWSAPVAIETGAASDVGLDSQPDIATNGSGSWVAVWTSDAEPGSGFGTDSDVFSARSSDGGNTWASTVAVNGNAASDTGPDSQPTIAVDGAGNWLTAWTSRGAYGSDDDILVTRSSDGGATWTPVAPLGTNAASDVGDDSTARIVTDRAGNWMAVWQSSDSLSGTIGGDLDVLIARSTNVGATWSAPLPLNVNAATDSGDDTTPHVATDGRGTWLAVWSSTDSLGGTIGNEGDILVARSTNAGQTWSLPKAVRANAATDIEPESAPWIATDAAGNWNVVWLRIFYPIPQLPNIQQRQLMLSRSNDAGLTWSTPQILANWPQTTQRLVTDRVGHWIAAFDSTFEQPSALASPGANIFQNRGTGPDADADGLSDGAEVNLYGTNSHGADTDFDGLSDGLEVLTHFTNPLDVDTDEDGVSDGVEVALGYDPKNRLSTPPGAPQVPALHPAARILAIALLGAAGLGMASRRSIRSGRGGVR